MELQFKDILVVFVLATLIPSVMLCNPDPVPEQYEAEWAENNRMCGTSVDNGKIAGGDDVLSIRTWPWLAYMRTNKNGGTFRCAAELIAWGWATTAAHCLKDDNDRTVSPADVTLAFGAANIRDGAAPNRHVANVQRIIIHPGFIRRTLDKDIAILQLSASVDYTDFVRPVCMPAGRAINMNNCWVAGWGRDENGQLVDQLQELQVQVFQNSAKCREDDHICSTSNPNTGTRRADSGGPLMCKIGDNRWDLVGINSHDDDPDVFTRVSTFSQWITDEINNHGGPQPFDLPDGDF